MTEKTGIFLPVSEVFPDMQSDFETFKSLLFSLSLTDTLFWCGRLNLIISDPESDHLTKQQAGLSQFFTPEEINKVNDFVKKNGGVQEVTIFFRGQLLELIRWVVLFCSDFPEDGTTFEDPIIRRNFAKAVLIASDIWSNRIFGNRFSSEGDQTIARKRALGAIRKSIEGTARAHYLIESLGRGWHLFSEFKKYYKPFEGEFQKETDLSIEEYYCCLAAIAVNFTNPKIKSGLMNVREMDNSTLYGSALKKFINLESQTVDELKPALWGNTTASNLDNSAIPDFNYLPIREKPIFRTKDGRAIILDPVFYAEKMTVGPLFLLPREKREEAFTCFGKAFEDYVCSILGRMFPDLSGVTNKRLTCNISGKDQDGQVFEIDACLNDLTEVVLFEVKTGFIREENILDDDYERFLKELRKKYVEGPDGNKGIGQLVRLIQILASKKWLGENQEFDQVKRIYPVIVVHDSLVSAPVYGQFFASEFLRLLIPNTITQVGECTKRELNITLPIVITINDLENLETSIEHFGFRDLLSDYSKSCPDRVESLHNFIASSRYKKHMYHNRHTATSSIDIIEKGKKAFSPDVNDSADST